jgi:hypothetical protein
LNPLLSSISENDHKRFSVADLVPRAGGTEVVEKWLKYLMEHMMMGFFSIFERDRKETPR